MLDVKNLVQGMLRAWWFILAVLLLLDISSLEISAGWMGFSTRSFGEAGRPSHWWVFWCLSTFLDFSALFTGFHRIFFTGDTWLFYTSDSLIRLFPERFWSDAFLYIGIFTIAGGLIAIFGGRALAKRFEKPLKPDTIFPTKHLCLIRQKVNPRRAGTFLYPPSTQPPIKKISGCRGTHQLSNNPEETYFALPWFLTASMALATASSLPR